MSYNILGVNVSHNSSIALVSNGKLVFYLEEERLSRFKRDYDPYFLLKNYLPLFKIDQINFVDTGDSLDTNIVINLLQKIFNLNSIIPKIIHYNECHHLAHASCAFHHSGFDKANNIVIDYGGNIIKGRQESESIFFFDKKTYPKGFEIYKSYNDLNKEVGIVKTYSGAGQFFDIDIMEGGKLMGLSSYGKKDFNIPSFFINGKSNPKIIKNSSFNNIQFNPKELEININNLKNELKTKTLSEKGKNIAYKIQQESQEEVAKLVEKSLQFNNCKNITLSGGFGLNCVNNYYLKKKFPKVNFYFEPISHDGGTAIGIAYLECKNLKSNKLKSLYLGPKYSNKNLLKKIQKYLD